VKWLRGGQSYLFAQLKTQSSRHVRPGSAGCLTDWRPGCLAVWQFGRIWQCFIISLRPGFCILSAKFFDYGPCAWVTLMLSKMDLVLDLNLLGRLCVIYALVFRAAVDDWQRQLPANNYSSHLVIWINFQQTHSSKSLKVLATEFLHSECATWT